MTIKETQDELISDFSLMENWMDKYEYIIQLGKELPLIDEKYKTPDNLIKGCQSQVWLHTELVDGKLVFTADSDAVITKGLISLMVSVLSNHTPREINEADLYFIEAIGLTSHLSPTRSNGLVSMLKQMKMYAFAYEAKSQSHKNGTEL
jgi:cysteine desulfuration protein SufE